MNQSLALLMTSFPLLEDFTPQGAEALLEGGEVREYHAGELVFSQGDTAEFVLLVLTGTLDVFAERNGNEMVLTEATAGEVLGELAVLCGITRSASVRARDAATALLWRASAFRTMLLRYPLLSERIFKQSLRTLVEKERSLIDSIMARGSGNQGK